MLAQTYVEKVPGTKTTEMAYDRQEIALRLMVTFSYSLLHPRELLIG